MSNSKPFRSILLFGAPGVGKGTQGEILGLIPGFFHMSVGDVFRSIDVGSDEGKEVYRYSSKGQLVPDELTVKIWKKALHAFVSLSTYKPREDLLILDGIPRNPTQVELVQENVEICKVINLACKDTEKMVDRLKRRAIRENRADDANESVIRKRFEVFSHQSAFVLDCYAPEMIATIEATGSPAQVLSKILQEVIPIQDELFREQGL
jgi:adenylate kinase